MFSSRHGFFFWWYFIYIYMKGLVTVGALGLIVATLFIPQPQDKVVFLDVGQGDAILIQKGTQQVLVDGGLGMVVLRRLREELPWFDRKIEVVVATHPDRDHLEGLLHVMERYEVALVLLPQMPSDTQLQAIWLNELKSLVEQKRTSYRFGWAGQELEMNGVKLTILGPWREGERIVAPQSKTNNAAVLARVDFPTAGEASGMSFLLTSDAEAPVEKMLVGNGSEIDVDVLKAGHHGSKTSTTLELLKAASPAAVVVSVGADNRYGHPHAAVMDRLKTWPVWRTDRDGSVKFSRYNNKWYVSRRTGTFD